MLETVERSQDPGTNYQSKYVVTDDDFHNPHKLPYSHHSNLPKISITATDKQRATEITTLKRHVNLKSDPLAHLSKQSHVTSGDDPYELEQSSTELNGLVLN